MIIFCLDDPSYFQIGYENQHQIVKEKTRIRNENDT